MLDALPKDLVCELFSFLDWAEISALAAVCTALRAEALKLSIDEAHRYDGPPYTTKSDKLPPFALGRARIIHHTIYKVRDPPILYHMAESIYISSVHGCSITTSATIGGFRLAHTIHRSTAHPWPPNVRDVKILNPTGHIALPPTVETFEFCNLNGHNMHITGAGLRRIVCRRGRVLNHKFIYVDHAPLLEVVEMPDYAVEHHKDIKVRIVETAIL